MRCVNKAGAGIVASGIVAAACGDTAVVESSALAEWSVAPDPIVVIGQEGRPGHELFRVANAMQLSDGRIAVVNTGSYEVRFYSPEGEFLGAAGREGGGPEEFRRIRSSARIANDTILIHTMDPAIAGVSAEMEVVRKNAFDVSIIRIPCRIAESGVQVVSGDVLVVQAEDNLGNPGCPANPGGVRQSTELLGLARASAGYLDTLGVFPGTDRDGPRYGAFGRMLAVAASERRIFAGETGGDSIAVYDLEGNLVGTWRHTLPAVPLSDAAKSYVPQPREMPDGRIVTPEPYTMPATYPRFGRLLADRSGNLWVMAYPILDEPISSWRLKSAMSHTVEAGGARWQVLDESGKVLASVRTPSGLYPLEIGEDYVLGLALDSLDVETVRVHRLMRH